MSLLVVGSIAFDTVETPFGRAEEVLGGSAIYFSHVASFFTNVRLCGIVGSDFPESNFEDLSQRGVDLDGLQRADGPTFRWSGRYVGDMSAAETLQTQLNVYGDFEPLLPESYRNSRFAFLANGPTDIQHTILDQLPESCFVLADTMNLWIQTQHDLVMKLLRRVSGMILNDGEARMLSGETNLIKAGNWIRQHGPEYVIIKKGEHGAIALGPDGFNLVPAFPAETVCDPTGAGDTFAGGLMGALAESGTVNGETMARALVYATVVASFTIEDFSLDRLRTLTRAEIDLRYDQFRKWMPR